jgi:hypothetical protein
LRLEPKALGIEEILRRPASLPSFYRVRRPHRVETPVDAALLTAQALGPQLSGVQPGQRIAIAVGSRGISQIAVVVQCCVRLLKEIGAEPFIVPAMGSHGGATAEGQTAILAGLGIREDTVGAPILATMDTVDLVEVAPGLHAHLDAAAAAADGILLVNRIKGHTSFDGPIESGLAKMTAIGLGKQRGAEQLHQRGPAQISDRIRTVARAVISRSPVIGGLGLVEGPTHELHRVAFLHPEEIGEAAEVALLEEAKALEPRIPIVDIDVLIVDAIGKDKSGTGMDTNVVGRRMIRGTAEPLTPRVTNIVALGLTPASGGNAIGIGLADFVPATVVDQIDLVSTYANALTAGLQGVQRAQIPIVLATDRDAVMAALLTASLSDTGTARIVRIRDTLTLDDLMVSEALLAECIQAGFEIDTEIDGSSMGFTDDGAITRW